MEKLKHVLQQEDTVLFVGSGISMWSGLPSWRGMIEELAQFVESTGASAELVRTEAQNGDLLQAASYGFDKLTKPQIGEFIRAACRLGTAKPVEIHRKLVSLGPRCFVTTNYDNLIEESLRQWQPDRFFRPPVTNRQLTEIAEIVHARAIDFVFKPHGDAADCESIILTREQYRQLLPQGERQAALESLKVLLASRPVVYFGFGLRDPDFIYVKDLLVNTYKGGTRDHYAIIADVSDAECDYWRRNYGIHLISYATTLRADKSKDHTAILALLNVLLEKIPTPPAAIEFDPSNPEVILALARYAARLARCEQVTPEFLIRVRAETDRRRVGRIFHRFDKFDHCPVETLLDEGPERALMTGLPGAGKSYSFHRAAARLAEKLHEVCLREPFDEKSVFVPLLADFKMCRGDLGDLVAQTLPKSLPFDEVIKCFNVKVFLDSFNEMPRKYWESGCYESDLENFITRIGQATLIIGSRTNDGLAKLELPTYCLDHIDESDLKTELERLGIEVSGRFAHEVFGLLQKPFYFQFIANRNIALPDEAHPRDLYQLFFQNLRQLFARRFGVDIDIERALSLVAYDALNSGEEAFPLAELLRFLRTGLESAEVGDIDVRDIANWLVARSVLIPFTGARVAFVHQSVTEFLAATELARQFQVNPHILKEKLSVTRWDQALFLTLSLLSPAQADAFLQVVIEVDLALALNAVKYMEAGGEEVVAKLLSEILESRSKRSKSDFDFRIEWAVKHHVPITDAHEPHLRSLIMIGGSLGGAAVVRLVELKGSKVKDELLRMLVDCRSDFNFCVNGLAAALKPFAAEEDARKLAQLADSIQDETLDEDGDASNDDDDTRTHGFTNGAAKFLSDLDISVIRREFLPPGELVTVPALRAQIMCDYLYEQERDTTAPLELAGELLNRGVKHAALVIYLILKFPEQTISLDSLTAVHVNKLVSGLNEAGEHWELNALRLICPARPDLAKLVGQLASSRTGLERALLLNCVSPADLAPIFEALGDLTEMTDDDRRKQPIGLLRSAELDWSGRDALYIRLLKLRDNQLAAALLGDSIPPSIENLGDLEIRPIDWWLNWMIELDDRTPFLKMKLGALLATHVDREIQSEFVAEFNKADSEFRSLLSFFVLPYLNDLSTDDFGEEGITFLMAQLNRDSHVDSFHGHLLGRTATEQFVTERLLPLVPDAKQPLVDNLKAVLSQAGSRHGRRYIVE